MDSKKLGVKGENIAVSFLKRKKFRILKRNFKVKIGEIDIIAKKKEVIHFIEVKTRDNADYDSAVGSINSKKQLHIKKAADAFLLHYQKFYSYCQFDAIIILFKNSKLFAIHFLENIF